MRRSDGYSGSRGSGVGRTRLRFGFLHRDLVVALAPDRRFFAEHGDADHAYVRSLMAHPVTEPGTFANWIAPPARGINAQPADFAYVRSNEA